MSGDISISMSKAQFFSLVGFLVVSFATAQATQWNKTSELVTGVAVINANFQSLEKTLTDHATRIYNLEKFHQNGGR